jgi:hypothetical protein
LLVAHVPPASEHVRGRTRVAGFLLDEGSEDLYCVIYDGAVGSSLG